MITRAHMRRQLRATGGITNARQGYGIGSWVKEKVRKLIPNELADIASKAAPFVAMLPGYGPAAAGLMRGIGRFDKRGSMSDALKQGIGTYAGGKLFGEGMERFAGRQPGGSALETLGNLKDTAIEKTGDLFSGDKQLFKNLKVPGLGGVTDLAKQQLLFGTISGGISYIYEKFMKEEPEQQPGESMGEFLARRKKNVATKMRAYKDNYLAFDKDWSSMTNEEKNEQIQSELTEYDVPDANMNQGGRVGYEEGTTNPALMKRMMELMLQGIPRHKVREEAEKQLRQEPYINERIGTGPGPLLEAANGGLMRPGYAIGSPEKQMEAGAPPIIYEGNMDPNARNQQAGLPSIPGPMQMAEDGPEFDMRQQGGFQPLGRQEGKDDVPAMLAKNEFVMTADAVRAAGGGSIQKGAQRMYDTMKKLESRVA